MKEKDRKKLPLGGSFLRPHQSPNKKQKKKLPAQARKCLPLVCGPSNRGATTTNSQTPRDCNCVSNGSKHQAQVAFPTGTLKGLRPKFTFYGEISPNWTEVMGDGARQLELTNIREKETEIFAFTQKPWLRPPITMRSAGPWHVILSGTSAFGELLVFKTSTVFPRK